MSSKYAWHPSHRPPPADPSIAGRIATMGPVGKCLETALDELLAEAAGDPAMDDDGDDGDCADCGQNNPFKSKRSSSQRSKNEKRKRGTGDIIVKYSKEREAGGTANNKNSNQETAGASVSELEHPNRLDSSMKKSILEAYGKAVAETEFDCGTQKSYSATAATSDKSVSSSADDHTTSIDAPAAMLKGEIDHYNRVGGQWRIVVKNAILKPRMITKVENGMTGRSLRRRTVLDWDDESIDHNGKDNGRGKKSVVNLASASDDCRRASDVHHFRGTIQILAYDDET